MKYMRYLVIIMVLVLIEGAFHISPTSCISSSHSAADSPKGDTIVCDYTAQNEDSIFENDNDEETVSDQYHWEPPVIPAFVKRLIPNGDWSADTICVVDGKAYYFAYASHYQKNVIYSKDGILVTDPTLRILALDENKKLFHVSIAGKDVLVDFSDSESLQRLSALSPSLSGFTSFSYDVAADFCERVQYNIMVDFPKSTTIHSEAVTKWLVEKIEDSGNMDGELPPLNAIYINYARRTNAGWRYDDEIHNHKRICKFAADVYFAIVKSDYGLNEMDVPSSLFSTLCLSAYVMNRRYVTYQQFKHDYCGGAHGYYTERLISFDHIHRQEIDYKYLFKDGCMEDILALLKEEAKKSPNYQEWGPDIDEYACVKDENDEPTGQHRLPQPGLSEDGVVFSFQPYEISCFAAGTFHFTIPYDRLESYLTDRGKWCLNIK